MNLIVFSFNNIIGKAEEWSNITDDAKNLIRKMLTLDPQSRISAKDAYNDPWI